MTAGAADTSRTKRELLPDLEYPTLSDGLSDGLDGASVGRVTEGDGLVAGVQAPTIPAITNPATAAHPINRF